MNHEGGLVPFVADFAQGHSPSPQSRREAVCCCVGTSVLLQKERSGAMSSADSGYRLAASGHQGSPEFSREKGMTH